MIRASDVIFLLEDYYGRIKSDSRFPISKQVSTEVFVNPSRKELRDIGDSIRFLADTNRKQIFVWTAEIMHRQAEIGLFGYQSYKPEILLGVAERRGSDYEMTTSDQIVMHGQDMTLFSYDWTWADRYVRLTPYLEKVAKRLERKSNANSDESLLQCS
jgi:hypothetical protein